MLSTGIGRSPTWTIPFALSGVGGGTTSVTWDVGFLGPWITWFRGTMAYALIVWAVIKMASSLLDIISPLGAGQ